MASRALARYPVRWRDTPASIGGRTVSRRCLLRHLRNRPVWARQLNTEGDGVRIVNRGAPLWILGIKTEGANTAISSLAASRTEVLGGLLYPATPIPRDLPAFHVEDSSFTATVAESSYAAAAAYGVLLRGCSATGAVVDSMDTRPPPDRLGPFVLSLTYPSSGARESLKTTGGC
jgi:hypothetical protein